MYTRIVNHPAARAALLACGLLLAQPAAAQGSSAATGLPAGPYQIVVPVEPGGGIDAMARLVAQHWTTERQLQVVVLNRSGASGNIGTTSVARAQPDGQTLLVTAVSHLTSPMLHANAGYDPIDDFVPIARFGTAPNVLLVSDALKDLSLQQLLKDPRSRNQGFAYGSAGFGHSSHLAAEFFMARTGTRWLHVPFKGNAPALRALMAGEVQILFLSVPSVPAALASGRAHALGVAHRERLSLLPQIPTLAEQGVANADFLQWYGLLAPKGTPAQIVQALSAAALEAMRSPAVLTQLKAHAVEPDPLDHQQFARFLSSEQTRLQAVLRREGVERAAN